MAKSAVADWSAAVWATAVWVAAVWVAGVAAMPDWLHETEAGKGPATPGALAFRLILALVFGGVVAVVYRLSHGREKSDGLPLTSTLVLLSILIAMVSMVIGDSVTRAFSLVGALSIVRFRTVVEDTRDTAFVIFSVIVGMAAGAGLVWVPLVGIPIVSLASVGLSRLDLSRLDLSRLGLAAAAGTNQACTLCIRVGLGRDADMLFGAILARHLARQRVTAVGTARQGAAVEITYQVKLKPEATMTGLVTELNQVEGVMSVELNRLS
jgi:uncharacterized membrane protein HdeD (DUF308 family)